MTKLRVQRLQEVCYDMTPDGQPIVGEVDTLKGYYLMTGFSGHGFMLAPALGMVLSDYLTGKKPSLDIDGLSLKRFHEPDINVDKLII